MLPLCRRCVCVLCLSSCCATPLYFAHTVQLLPGVTDASPVAVAAAAATLRSLLLHRIGISLNCVSRGDCTIASLSAQR